MEGQERERGRGAGKEGETNNPTKELIYGYKGGRIDTHLRLRPQLLRLGLRLICHFLGPGLVLCREGKEGGKGREGERHVVARVQQRCINEKKRKRRKRRREGAYA